MRSFLNIRVLYYEFIAKTTNGFDGGCGADFGKFFAKIGHINFDIIVFGYHFGAPDMCKNIVFLNNFFFGADSFSVSGSELRVRSSTLRVRSAKEMVRVSRRAGRRARALMRAMSSLVLKGLAR